MEKQPLECHRAGQKFSQILGIAKDEMELWERQKQVRISQLANQTQKEAQKYRRGKENSKPKTGQRQEFLFYST